MPTPTECFADLDPRQSPIAVSELNYIDGFPGPTYIDLRNVRSEPHLLCDETTRGQKIEELKLE